MVKSRVHDLAAEFGVSSEQLLAMLKDMNIFVRSHMSALEGDQVSAVRVRWEREKRKQHEEEKPKKARRKKAAEAPAEVPAPVAEAGKPSKRRRTAAEVAQVEAAHQAEREEEEKRVAMFLAGEVDYLVATDAIGMGLNLDIAHVGFLSLRKFDGREVPYDFGELDERFRVDVLHEALRDRSR